MDLQLLGLGHNGHIGFNEPGEAFEKETHCVDLTESTIEANKRFFASANDVPKQAYTMGIKTIMQAKKILIVVNGENKADIVERAFFGPVTPEVPASILQLHNDVTVVGDEEHLLKLRFNSGRLWMPDRFITNKSPVVTGNMDEKRADQLRSAPFY